MKYDFSGWASKNDILCTDGTIIRKDAFKNQNGTIVPLVYNHNHDDIEEVLGHALLENRPEGVYAYCSLNDTHNASLAKNQVEHGDIVSLSIFANNLKRQGSNIIHGVIREISLVLAGADPKACIDNVVSHNADDGESAVIYYDEELFLEHGDKSMSCGDTKKKKPIDHADPDLMDEEEDMDDSEDSSEDENVQDVMDTLSSKQRKVVNFLLAQAKKGNTKPAVAIEHAGETPPAKKDGENASASADGEETVQEVLDTLSDKQKNVVGFIINEAVKAAKSGSSTGNTKENPEGGQTMKHNVFDTETADDQNVISHDDMKVILEGAKRTGSLKSSIEDELDGGVLAHAVTDASGKTVTYGAANIDYLFPEAKNITDTPEFIKRETEWVQTVMSSVHRTPFSRVKSTAANITMDEARAKGYAKGKLKKEEIFSLLKRTTDPQTIYKKQKMDREDISDIIDFDVVAWIKAEMRIMLDEELARAILIGDGRLSSDDDKISEDHIRPVATDAELYTIKAPIKVATTATNAQIAKEFIDTAVRSRKNYKGSGTPTLFTTEDFLTEMLLLEDTIGHKLYKSAEDLATAMRVSKIVTVEVMEDDQITVSGTAYQLAGVIVNLMDYNVGADKGGAVSLFEDFDIDYNQEKYLIETRCSGALIKPYAAISLYVEKEVSGS